jgi:hypothetical protein
MMPSAVGERQILPRQTKLTRILAEGDLAGEDGTL